MRNGNLETEERSAWYCTLCHIMHVQALYGQCPEKDAKEHLPKPE